MAVIRRLAVIFAADMAGYSPLLGRDAANSTVGLRSMRCATCSSMKSTPIPATSRTTPGVVELSVSAPLPPVRVSLPTAAALTLTTRPVAFGACSSLTKERPCRSIGKRKDGRSPGGDARGSIPMRVRQRAAGRALLRARPGGIAAAGRGARPLAAGRRARGRTAPPGNVAEAEKLCLEVLELAPSQPEALATALPHPPRRRRRARRRDAVAPHCGRSTPIPSGRRTS